MLPKTLMRRRLIPNEVLRFVGAVLVVTAAIAVGVFILMSQEATGEAQRGAEEVARVQGIGIAEPALTDGLLTGDPGAIAAMDRVVHDRVLDARTVRVKIWAASGKVLYSDEARLIGQTFTLGEDELRALHDDLVDSSVSDLNRPENRFERSFGRLLEVYLPIRTPSNEKVLFETYQEFASVQAQEQRIILQFAPVLVGGLLVLLILEIPLAWSMARRLEKASAERENLLSRAVNASEGERRRIARDLHDGVVQRLAGTSMSLAAHDQREAAAEIREAIRELRSLIVKIAPTGLTAENLPDALRDLAEPLKASGVDLTLEADRCRLNSDQALLVFRVAQEALRNVARHAHAQHVTVTLVKNAKGCSLTVSDDGRGFDIDAPAAASKNGHMGLSLLRTLAEDGGGTLRVSSKPGEGTRIEMTLP